MGIHIVFWVDVLLLIGASWIVKLISKPFLTKFFNRLRDRKNWDLQKLSAPLSWFIALFALGHFIPEADFTSNMITYVEVLIRAGKALTALWASHHFINEVSRKIKRWTDKTETVADDHLEPLVKISLRILFPYVILAILLNSYGYSINSMIAGLGIGGLAIALASQDAVKNLFGSFIIMIDQTFKPGDKVKIGSNTGIVKEITLRSTRLEQEDESTVIIPNSTITNGTITRY